MMTNAKSQQPLKKTTDDAQSTNHALSSPVMKKKPGRKPKIPGANAAEQQQLQPEVQVKKPSPESSKTLARTKVDNDDDVVKVSPEDITGEEDDDELDVDLDDATAASLATKRPLTAREQKASSEKLSKDTSSSMAPYTLVLCRHYSPPRDKNGDVLAPAKKMNQYSEAVLHKVLSMDKVPSLLMAMNGEWIVHQPGKRIKLCNDVWLTITKNERTDWDVKALELTLSSRTKTATQMVRYVEELYAEYVASLNNELGSNIYFFDQKETSDFRGNPFETTDNAQMQKKFEIINAPKCLSFQQLPFHSNKSFENLCGPEIDLISSRINFFVNNREWYDKKGVPYQVGFLLSGESGTGKSSCIRAIANSTGRHIVNVNFANIKTVTQLKKLFYSEELNVFRDEDSGEAIKLTVPLNKRVYVLEEIDALGSTIFERRVTNPLRGTGGDIPNAKCIHDEITLGDLLQVLDGNMETPGRIVIVTSNHPELLDEALIRPGRIDMMIRFGLASRDTIAKMYHKLHDRDLSPYHVKALPDGELSHADVMEVFFRNFGKPDMDNSILEQLRLRAQELVVERAKRAEASKAYIEDMLLSSMQHQSQHPSQHQSQHKQQSSHDDGYSIDPAPYEPVD